MHLHNGVRIDKAMNVPTLQSYPQPKKPTGGVDGGSKSSYFVDAFLGLFPSTVMTSWWLVAVVVLAVVVTAVVYEVGVAVTDPVPVGGTFTLLIVWVVTKLPPLVVACTFPVPPPFL